MSHRAWGISHDYSSVPGSPEEGSYLAEQAQLLEVLQAFVSMGE